MQASQIGHKQETLLRGGRLFRITSRTSRGLLKKQRPNDRCSSNKIRNEVSKMFREILAGIRLGYDFTGKLVPLFLKVAKTTINISGQEINKSRINIYTPKGMWVVFTIPLKYLIPVTAESTAPTKLNRLVHHWSNLGVQGHATDMSCFTDMSLTLSLRS